VGTGHGRAAGHRVAFRDHLVHLEVEVGEASSQGRDDLFQVRREARSQRLLVIDGPGCDRGVGVGDIALVEHALEAFHGERLEVMGAHRLLLLLE
jgi:hypothetical protein